MRSKRDAEGRDLVRGIASILLLVVRPANKRLPSVKAAHEHIAVPAPRVGQHLNRLFATAAGHFMGFARPAHLQGTAEARKPIISAVSLSGHAHLAVRHKLIIGFRASAVPWR